MGRARWSGTLPFLDRSASLHLLRKSSSSSSSPSSSFFFLFYFPSSSLVSRIVVALDCKDGRPTVRGWTEDAGAGDAASVARELAALGVTALLVTDVARDGAMEGPNLELLVRRARGVSRRDPRLRRDARCRGPRSRGRGRSRADGAARSSGARSTPERRRSRRSGRPGTGWSHDARRTRDPVPRHRGRPRREGRVVREPQGRRGPRRGRDPLRARGGRRGRVPGHRGARRGARDPLELVRRVANVLSIPFTVGGGVRSVEDADALLRAGADRVTVNTAAVNDPALLTRLSAQFGAQCVVLALDGKRVRDAEGRMQMMVTTHGGRTVTGRDVVGMGGRSRRRGRRRDPPDVRRRGRDEGGLRPRDAARRARASSTSPSSRREARAPSTTSRARS